MAVGMTTSSLSRLIRGLLLSLFTVMPTACSLLSMPDKKIADNAEAAWTYHDARYHRLCPAVDDPRPAGPVTCKAYKTAVDELSWHAVTAHAVQRIGALPPEEKKALALAEKEVAKLP